MENQPSVLVGDWPRATRENQHSALVGDCPRATTDKSLMAPYIVQD